MKVVLLGTTGYHPSESRHTPCMLLPECGVMFDAGTAMFRAPRYLTLPTLDIFLTHAHLDHSGRLPLLARRGFTGPVYATRATHDLLEVMLKDAAFLEQKDAEWENRRRERAGKKPIEPTFTIEDVEAILSQRRGLEYHQEQAVLPDLKVQLFNAGHILGAARSKSCCANSQVHEGYRSLIPGGIQIAFSSSASAMA